MYGGAINNQQIDKPVNFRTKFQMLSNEQVERNGVLTNEIKIKTREFVTDKTIKYRDFDILNLQAINALGELKETSLTPSNSKVDAAAAKANRLFEQIDIINKLENE